ncbi:aldehyde dehydrogenase family protein [Roseomonas sp. GC11]|uniref:aldehyde dehydrogenase family protein n=1 Tax=Roseomonas sp. GC11 TaxID=2950546 RepID=UPI00210881F2|nr:aldehyde dehydrogenase family protein [Roseomonas sp. GC11]MCQ4159904.1 aldehyde dehydrogenase family protein [Roseomonas sp. GC11]
MKQHQHFYIGGSWVEARGKGRHILVNPATEEAFATVGLGNDGDVDLAVRTARAAFTDFSATSREERLALLDRIIDGCVARQEDLARTLTEEMGSPVKARVQVTGAAEQFRQARRTLATYRFERMMEGSMVLREPIGVCGLITPWNWPVQSPCTKLAYALAAGCTVVLKPSEHSPRSALLLAEILHEAGVPAGVFNLVIGDGQGVGAAISRHPDIDLVSFTGSTRAGILVATAAAPTVKRVAQELGGKSANIILPGADLASAARWTIARGFFNSGQSCHAPSRLLVHRDEAAALENHLIQAAEALRVGNPEDPETDLGPLVNRAQFERVQAYIRSGIEEGARLLTGGPGRPAGLEKGYFVQPTVFADVTPAMTIAREEIFGPVLSLLSYIDTEEAIRLANDTPYGLGGYVFSADNGEALRVARGIRAGRIAINGAPAHPAAPMGGYKHSGNGREMGEFGLEEYLETKAIFGAAA